MISKRNHTNWIRTEREREREYCHIHVKSLLLFLFSLISAGNYQTVWHQYQSINLFLSVSVCFCFCLLDNISKSRLSHVNPVNGIKWEVSITCSRLTQNISHKIPINKLQDDNALYIIDIQTENYRFSFIRSIE